MKENRFRSIRRIYINDIPKINYIWYVMYALYLVIMVIAPEQRSHFHLTSWYIVYLLAKIWCLLTQTLVLSFFVFQLATRRICRYLQLLGFLKENSDNSDALTWGEWFIYSGTPLQRPPLERNQSGHYRGGFYRGVHLLRKVAMQIDSTSGVAFPEGGHCRGVTLHW